MNKSNLVGMRFGRLLVQSQTDSKHNRTRWVCLCDCGKTCIATSCSLQSGDKKSCSCLRVDAAKDKRRLAAMNTRLPDGEAAFNCLFHIYYRNARDRKLTFELDKDKFRALTKGRCHYCGAEPSRVFNNSGLCDTSYTCNGIDRLDNSIGYVLDNCVPCCKMCNGMKSNWSHDEFLNQCKIIVNNYKRLAEMPSPDSKESVT